MRVYQCDNCKTIIEDPYKVKMKEFYMDLNREIGAWFPFKRKKKICLCAKCYTNLRNIGKNLP